MCRYVTKLLTWLSWHFLVCTAFSLFSANDTFFSVVKFENLFKLYIFVPITRWFSGNQMNQTAVKPPSQTQPSGRHCFTAPKFEPEEKTKSRVSCAQTTWEFEKPKLWMTGDVWTSKGNKMASSNGSPDWETFVVHCSHELHSLEALTVYIYTYNCSGGSQQCTWSYKVENRIVRFDHQNGVGFWGLLMACYLKKMHFYPCLEADLADEWWSWLSNSLQMWLMSFLMWLAGTSIRRFQGYKSLKFKEKMGKHCRIHF